MFHGAKACQLQVSLNFHREQSSIDIRARFDREDLSRRPFKEQVMIIQIFANAFDTMSTTTLEQVVSEEALPPRLKLNPRAVNLVKSGNLSVLNLNYHPEKLHPIGLHNELDFSDANKLKFLKILQEIPQTSSIQIFLPCATDSIFGRTFNVLKSKLEMEWIQQPFSQYRSKEGKLM